MSKNKVKKKIQNNLKIFKSIPESIIDETKNKIGNFYQNLKKTRKNRKLRLEKEKRIQEKKKFNNKRSKLKKIK